MGEDQAFPGAGRAVRANSPSWSCEACQHMVGPDPKPCIPFPEGILLYTPIPTPGRADMHGELVGYRGCGIMGRVHPA